MDESIIYYDYHFLDEHLDYILSHPEEFDDLVTWAKQYKYSRSHKGDWKTIIKSFVNNWHLETYLMTIFNLKPLNPTFDHLELRNGNNDSDFILGNCLVEVKHSWTEEFTKDYLRHLRTWKINGCRDQDLIWANGKRYIEPKTKFAHIILIYTENKYGKQNKLVWCDTKTWKAWETDISKIKEWRY